MAVSVPASDVANTLLQSQITAVTAAITANPLTAASLTALLDQLQQRLVMNLIANATSRQNASVGFTGNKPSYLTAAGILSAGTINT